MDEQRERTERDLRGILADKDAEVARLRAEIGRLRHAFSKSDGLQEAHVSEVQQLTEQLERAQLASKASERQAILSSSTPAAGTAQGEIHRLRSELDACTAANARLEAELQKQSAAASTRLTELQDSYTAKIADMRRMHRDQLAAVEQSAREQQQLLQQSSEGSQLKAAQAELATLRQQAVGRSSEVATLEARLAAEQQAVARLTLQLNEAQGSSAAAQEQAKELAELRAGKAVADAKAAGLEQQLKQQQNTGQSGLGDEAMAAMLSMMEGQLARLSETIRAKDAEVQVRDAEIATLRQLVQVGCEERRELAGMLEKAQARAAAHAAAVQSPQQQTAKAPSPNSTPPVSHPHSLGSRARTGLVSRPKFKS